jgi:hypothetical protein
LADTDPFFDTLEPPPGGLTRLRARLRDPDPTWNWGRWACAAVAVAGVLLVGRAWVVPPDPFADALLAHLEIETVHVPRSDRANTAVQVVSETTEVVFIRVATVGSRAE